MAFPKKKHMIIFHYVASAIEYQYDNNMILEVWTIAWHGKCDSGSKYEAQYTITSVRVESDQTRIKVSFAPS